MADNAPAVWSAVAASFAALSSFLIMLIQRRNLLESVRPELVLTDWSREQKDVGESKHEIITFKSIKNVGRGPALHIVLNSHHELEGRPTVILSTTRIPILAANETCEVNSEILIFWKNASADDKGFKALPIKVSAMCWDSRGMRHETKYSLLAIELGVNAGVTDPIAPGVMFGSRTTTVRPVWLLKLLSRVQRIPLLKGVFNRLPKH